MAEDEGVASLLVGADIADDKFAAEFSVEAQFPGIDIDRRFYLCAEVKISKITE